MTIDRILNPGPAQTANEVTAALAIVLAVTETIREAGEVPEGILYATLMDRLDLAGFEKMIRLVVNTGLVTRANHLLRWVGPTLAPACKHADVGTTDTPLAYACMDCGARVPRAI